MGNTGGDGVSINSAGHLAWRYRFDAAGFCQDYCTFYIHYIDSLLCARAPWDGLFDMASSFFRRMIP